MENCLVLICGGFKQLTICKDLKPPHDITTIYSIPRRGISLYSALTFRFDNFSTRSAKSVSTFI